MHKLVISDLDGTLLNSDHELSQYTKETVEKLVKKGIKFFIATGRHHIDAEVTKKSLGLKEAYMITSNGARVHDHNGNLLISHDHKEEVAKDIINMEINKDIHINIFTEEKWFAFETNKRIEEWVEKTDFKYNIIDKDKLDFNSIIKWYYLADHDILVELKEKIEEKWDSEVECLFSLPDCLEIMPKGVSKGKAIEEIIAIEKIDQSETMAFGDGFNDLEMLSYVDKGLIMENAHEKLKTALPHNQIIGPNSEDGVAKHLSKVFQL